MWDAQLKDEVDKLCVSKLEDAQCYEKKLADAETRATESEAATKELRSILYTVSKQLDHKDRKIASSKEKIDRLQEELKRYQNEAQIRTMELDRLKEQVEFQTAQAEMKKQEAELEGAHS